MLDGIAHRERETMAKPGAAGQLDLLDAKIVDEEPPEQPTSWSR
jgi:hypothetical protein